MELHQLSVRTLSKQLITRNISAYEVVTYFLSRIDKIDPGINSIIARNDDASLVSARLIDEKRARREVLHPLAGIPFAVKDLEDAIGYVTTYGSKYFSNPKPAMANSRLVQRFSDLGAIPIAKTNTSEFGWKATTDNALFGHTRNPYAQDRTPGGSSGGTAAGVAAGIVPFGTASDGGGSIRIPAACCAIAGLKTSVGQVPGGIQHPPNWWELATAGPMARTVLDTAWLYDIAIQHDDRDMLSALEKTNDWSPEATVPDYSTKIAVSRNLGYWTTDHEILLHFDQLIDFLDNAGFEVIDIPQIFSEPPYYSWEKLASAYLARSFGHLVPSEKFSLLETGLQNLILQGSRMSATDFVRSLDRAWELSSAYFETLGEATVLITPTTAGIAPVLDSMPLINSQETPDWVSYTSFANLLRIPALNVPIGLSHDNVPISIQIHGRRYREAEILRLGAFIERHNHIKPPDCF